MISTPDGSPIRQTRPPSSLTVWEAFFDRLDAEKSFAGVAATDDGLGVRNRVERDIVALECFDECFCYSVGSKAAYRRRARLRSEIS